jgi:hypothetical protein
MRPLPTVLLRIRTRRQRELHQVGDALLTSSAMWILHAERLRFGILI